MKNRKTAILAVVLAAVMCVGIGYAAVTQTLTITGTGRVSEEAANEAFNDDVYFSEAHATNGVDTASVQSNNDEANFNCTSLKGKGDTATFTFKVKNEGDLNAKIAAIPTFTVSEGAEYFSVTHNWGTSKTINAGAEETLTVTVTLLKTPTAQVDMECTISLNVEGVNP